ncbi:hypothetical protein GCM10010218_05290 [Streptomyces mashuensis]|uniref:Uncharacterized protein n=1 Tax=Streptomyces mashuensis TaxID=33904 RepID=A0A919AUX8_9ACTN|nr:hypothetical protein [Streptomyces mashuensis]GHF27291.1 hypothetical protein GCM10010218_05290 [Streptomyces mashuensis]
MDTPEPHVIVGRHPELGYVALNPQELFVADHVLKLLGFQPVPDSKLYALANPENDGERRAQQAIASLRAARYQVAADISLDPTQPQQTPVRRHTDEHRQTMVRGTAPRATPTAQAAVTKSAAWQSRTDLKPIPPRPKHPPLWAPRSQMRR